MGVLLFAFVRAILWNPPERASRSIKLHAASPAQGQSTRFAQGRGVARTATNPVLRSAVNTSAAAAVAPLGRFYEHTDHGGASASLETIAA
jgi:hypothetical protein